MDITQYPSPKPFDVPFSKYWEKFIPAVEGRENLKSPHLSQLEILCDMYVEMDYLKNLLEVKGKTYESEGRNGMQIKPRPEIAMLRATISDVYKYSKLLGFQLYKDNETVKKGTKNEFEEDEENSDD